jgi:hypothetical protein
MNIIQVILLLSTSFLYLYFILRVKKSLIGLLFFSLLALGAFLFILSPDTSTLIAKKLGVQRGADMVFYLSILAFWYLIMKLYARIKNMEQMLTILLREDALKTATHPS